VVAAPVPPVPPLNAATSLPVITADTPAAEAAALLAEQMRRIPGIERHLAIPLVDLDQRGPRPVRAAWRLAKTRVAARYGDLTVGELMSRFGPSGESRTDNASLGA
jgi:hypothetical protein